MRYGLIIIILTFIIYWIYQNSFSFFLSRPYAETMNNNAPIKFFVINLDKAKDRLKAINKLAKTNKMYFSRFPAVNGNDVLFRDMKNDFIFLGSDISDNIRNFTFGRKYEVYCNGNLEKNSDYIYDLENKTDGQYYQLSSGEIGLLCTNIKLLEKIYKSEEEYIAVILEDDAKMLPNFKEEFSKIRNSFPKRWDIIFLDFYLQEQVIESLYFKKLREWNKHFILLPPREIWGTHAFVVNKESARFLHEQIIKYYNHLPLDMLFSELLLERKINAFVVKDKLVEVNTEFQSDIEKMGRPDRYKTRKFDFRKFKFVNEYRISPSK